jgi:hypothetical protein
MGGNPMAQAGPAAALAKAQSKAATKAEPAKEAKKALKAVKMADAKMLEEDDLKKLLEIFGDDDKYEKEDRLEAITSVTVRKLTADQLDRMLGALEATSEKMYAVEVCSPRLTNPTSAGGAVEKHFKQSAQKKKVQEILKNAARLAGGGGASKSASAAGGGRGGGRGRGRGRGRGKGKATKEPKASKPDTKKTEDTSEKDAADKAAKEAEEKAAKEAVDKAGKEAEDNVAKEAHSEEQHMAAEAVHAENAGVDDPHIEVTSFFAYSDLKEPPFPSGVDPSQREKYLSDEEFEVVFEMDKQSFAGKWLLSEILNLILSLFV